MAEKVNLRALISFDSRTEGQVKKGTVFSASASRAAELADGDVKFAKRLNATETKAAQAAEEQAVVTTPTNTKG